MVKKLLFILLPTALALTVNNTVIAAGFVIDPAAIFKTWYEINHWAGVTAIVLLTAMITAAWKMPPVKNETKAVMVSDLFRLGRYVIGILLFIEYYELLTSWIINIVDFLMG